MPESGQKLQASLNCQLPASLASAQGGGRRETNTGLWALGCSVYKALSVFSVFSFSEASRPILRAEDSILGAFQMTSPWMRTPDLSLSRRSVSLLHLQTTKSRKTPSLGPTRAESSLPPSPGNAARSVPGSVQARSHAGDILTASVLPITIK